MSTIRLVLGMVATENLHLEQLDVKTAFFHGDLEEDIYMIQSKGFIVQGQENLVYKLRKSLYGLKQAPRQWYKKFDSLCIELGSKNVKLITVAMLSLLTILTSYYCCMWMIYLLQGLALRRLII